MSTAAVPKTVTAFGGTEALQAFNGRAHDPLTPYLRRDVRGVHPSPSHYQSYLKSARADLLARV